MMLYNPCHLCNPQVGNKSDLLRARQVPAEEGEGLAASLGETRLLMTCLRLALAPSDSDRGLNKRRFSSLRRGVL